MHGVKFKEIARTRKKGLSALKNQFSKTPNDKLFNCPQKEKITILLFTLFSLFRKILKVNSKNIYVLLVNY